MKTEDLLTAAAAAVLAFVAFKTFARPGAIAGPSLGYSISPTSAQMATAINNPALPGQDAWGWSYFTDGTAIAPNGDYYLNGTKVWSANP